MASLGNDEARALVKGVTFDLDDTLWSAEAVLGRAEHDFHAFLEQRAPPLAAAFPPHAFAELLMRFQREFPEHAHNYTYLRKRAIRHCVDTLGAPTLSLHDDSARDRFLEDAFQAFLVPRSQPTFFSSVERLLTRLTSELTAAREEAPGAVTTARDDQTPVLMGAITNGNCMTDFLPTYFTSCLRFLVSAESVGAPKPAQAVFDAAIAQFPAAIARHELVHVGDHYRCDVEGAKQAGMRTIWVHAEWPAHKPEVWSRAEMEPTDAESFPHADAIVRDVGAVADVVLRWNAEARAMVTAAPQQ